MTPPTLRPRLPWIGALLGLAVGLLDYTVARAIGLEMTLAGRDVAVPVMAIFGLTYAALGYLLGRARVDAGVIRSQIAALEASHARALQNEKLASIGRLAAGVAHEVRNPLAVIRSSASLLAEEGLSPEDAEKAVRFIQEEIDRVDAFIGALLDFSRPVETTACAVDARELVERAARLAREAGFRVEVEGAAGEVTADPDQVVQALFSLVVNAGEACGEGGRVRLRVVPDGDAVVFEVADDGPGVRPGDAGRVFEPFFTTKAKGTGLGLPMAARLAEANGGALALAPGGGLGPGGRGACFRLRLPRRRAAA